LNLGNIELEISKEEIKERAKQFMIHKANAESLYNFGDN